MNIEIHQAALEDKTILRHLMELYAYDFSEFDQCDVDAHGLFGYNRLDHYWTEPGRQSPAASHLYLFSVHDAQNV